MTFYDEMRGVADEMLTEFGQNGAIRRTVTAEGAEPWLLGASEVTDYACTLVVTSYSDRDVDGTLILSSDRKVLVSAAGLEVEPSVSDKLIIGFDIFEIVSIDPLSPAGTVVMYTIQGRAVGSDEVGLREDGGYALREDGGYELRE